MEGLYKKKANQIIKHIHNIDKNVILIGVGGIDSPESAWERICSGASLIQLYTGWIYKGPQLVPDILEGIIKQHSIWSIFLQFHYQRSTNFPLRKILLLFFH